MTNETDCRAAAMALKSKFVVLESKCWTGCWKLSDGSVGFISRKKIVNEINVVQTFSNNFENELAFVKRSLPICKKHFWKSKFILT